MTIGSNIGYYALLAAKRVGSVDKVLTIEPNPVAFECSEKKRRFKSIKKHRT